jgi:hypothetical protein
VEIVKITDVSEELQYSGYSKCRNCKNFRYIGENIGFWRDHRVEMAKIIDISEHGESSRYTATQKL